MAASHRSGSGIQSCPPYSLGLLQVLRSLHDWFRDPDMCGYRLLDSFRAAVGACYKFFIPYMIGPVIQAFKGIYIGFVRSWRFSSCSVIPFTVFRNYHTTYVMLIGLLQVIRSLHDWLRDPDMCGLCLLDSFCAAVGIHMSFSSPSSADIIPRSRYFGPLCGGSAPRIWDR